MTDDARLNLTLTAFYGEKPRQLAELIAFCQERVLAHVPNGFEPYEPAQVHATIIGLEGRWIDGRLHNDNLLQRGERRCMDIENALRFLQATNMLPFQARIAGFHADEDFGFESFGRHPYERSFELQTSNAVVAMGWPVAGSTFTNALDDLRRELLRFNVLHKYHAADATVDNDLFFVLGTVTNDSIDELERIAISDSIRAEVATMEPVVVDVDRKALSLVQYEDRRLPLSTSVRFPLGRDDSTYSAVATRRTRV